jgi:hypothetical protein
MTRKDEQLEDIIKWINSKNTFYSFPEGRIQNDYKKEISCCLLELIDLIKINETDEVLYSTI